MPSRVRLRVLVLLTAPVSAFVVCGCGDLSALDPRSDASRDIATLWWWMLGIAAVVFFGALAMLVLSWRRRAQEGLPLLGTSERAATTLVVVFGMGIPIVVLSGLFGVGNLAVMPATDAPAPSSTRLTIQIVGHQWFWEVRYPGRPAVTANEVHIPTDTRINVVATTADVIHSLWVPQLNRKIDTIPGQRNRVLWYADRPGSYRGQCAEFCGLQHAHMAMSVVAQPPAQFQAWLRRQSEPAATPTSDAARHGEQLFLDNACAACHTIRGTDARGKIGPDLTHVASRATLAALMIRNTPENLQYWITDPQHIKPGAKMPGLDLSGNDFSALRAYLEGLR
jgi:cytochrome c oxidase subunit 2